MPTHRISRHLLVIAAMAAAGGSVAAQSPQAGGGLIYSCVAASGRSITADRPIAECMDREQRVLRRDGSLDRIISPPLSAEQRAAKDARERQLAQDKRAQLEATRRDRNLLQRYPDQAAHDKARDNALRAAQEALAMSERRLAELAKERQPLQREGEFYKGKAMPPKLRQQINLNDAASEAQQASAQNLRAEVARVNALYDTELEQLKRLWGGAAPGSQSPVAAVKSDRAMR